ncbi:MAG: hypothetical protein Kow0047_29340 [Anaerolineae bacterium]
MRVLIREDPFGRLDDGRAWNQRGTWPCWWITCPRAGEPPFVAAYRLRFHLDEAVTARVHVTADERYELFLDGERIGRGSERGDANNWFYETYDLDLSAGEHVIVARVWSLGRMAPYAQMTVHPGFLFAPEDERLIPLLGSGVAPWEARTLPGYEFVDPRPAWGTGANLILHGQGMAWGFERGEGEGWEPAQTVMPGANGFIRNEFPPSHLLKPATLPPMLEVPRRVGRVRHVSAPDTADTRGIPVRQADHLADEAQAWQRLIEGVPLTVPPHTRHRVLIDLDDYYCAYPEMTVSGGAGSTLRLLWAEALYEGPDSRSKGDRNAIEGKYFRGVGDTFLPDGGSGRRFDTLWWQAGRYLELLVETGDASLTIESFILRETRYPLEMESSFSASDQRLEEVIPIAFRALQMCSHETYMDCPYYEQLMYVGDTRLEVLTTYVTIHDDRLPRKALRMFDASRRPSGITQSRYPSRVTQVIPPFSLWWVGMVYDYALWRGDRAFVKSLMPGVRAVIDAFLSFRNDDGLIQGPNGWNYMDWVPAWRWGIPPDGEFGVNGIINWQMAWTLALAAELEAWVGEPELSARAHRLADELAERAQAAFWDESRGLFADDLAKTQFSEHAQCLAILSGRLAPETRRRVGEALLTTPDLARTTIYFTHYLFETYRELGRIDALLDRLSLWFDLKAMGFKTTVESPEPSRSDCHAWGAHPIYHYFATILGIRPATWGFEAVRIEPQLGPLRWVRGRLVHPRGEIAAELALEDGALHGRITLPEGVIGTLHWGGQSIGLRPGAQDVHIAGNG